MEIKGRNLVDGLPKDILIRSEEVRDAMNDCLLRIVEAIKDTLECTPPELSSDIIDRGDHAFRRRCVASRAGYPHPE